MRDSEGIQYMKELLADGCTAKQLHGWISEAEKARTACLNYLSTPGVWRVEFSRSFGQVPRIHYVETVANLTPAQSQALSQALNTSTRGTMGYPELVIPPVIKAVTDPFDGGEQDPDLFRALRDRLVEAELVA